MASLRSYKYSFGAWWGKLLLWLFLTFIIVSLLFDFLGALLGFVQGDPSRSEINRFILSIVVGLFIISYAVNLYPNVETVEDGLLIDFFWWKRKVQWGDLKGIIETGNMAFKVWAVEASNLTLIHRVYGFIYARSFNSPCFLIFANLPEHQALIKEIKRHLPKA